uniref:NADH-ubiquinone oxidoreductase chain 6 n=1 Tax=Chilocorus bipustulatus TaxID=703257 RepID=A0A6B9MR48_9CUCU|nr:NADH dehydrogenase subunit 6 [Chilocorus bipustulatus]
MFTLSSMLIFMKHPLSLGITILIQTFLICLNMGFMSMNFWFSYILILVMIGGLLILFIYMTSIASNEKFYFNLKLIIFSLLMIILLTMFIKYNFKFDELMNKNFLTNQINMSQNFYYSMSKFYNLPSIKILIIIILYLLITLIAVVKICSTKNGPLRQMFYENTNSKNKFN